MENKSNKAIKSITGLILITFLFKVLGFLRELLLSFFFGASGFSDAYLISQTIPGTIFSLIGVGISTCFVPLFFRVLTEKDELESFQFTNRITTIALSFSAVVILIVVFLAEPIVKGFASGFSGQTLYYASNFTRIGILSLFFSTYGFVYEAYLQAKKKFIVTALAGVIVNACVLLSIVLGATVNIWLISVVSTLAVGVKLIVMIPSVRKTGYKAKLCFSWNNRYVKIFLKMMLPVIIGTSISDVNLLIDRTIASGIAVGGISALTYSNSVLQLVIGGIVQPFSTVVYPHITEQIHINKIVEAVDYVGKMVETLLFVLIPITFGIVIYSKPVVSLLFQRGAFSEDALVMTSQSLACYGLGLCFMGIRELISRIFYASEDSKTPMINSSLGLVINIILNLWLSTLFGLRGLALATSISALVTCILLILTLKKVTGGVKIRFDIAELMKIILASVVMSLVSFLVYHYCFFETKLGFVVSVAVAVVVYLVLSIIIKTKSVLSVYELISVFRDNKSKKGS